MAIKNKNKGKLLAGTTIRRKDEIRILAENMEARVNSSYITLNINSIKENPDNSYYNKDDERTIAPLANDIERNGLEHNLVVSRHSNGTYLLLSGERRLKALKILAEKDPEKWSNVHVKCYESLDHIDELLILDSANLHTRTGVGEAIGRKAQKRYVENLKMKYGVSKDSAIEYIKMTSSLSDRTIDRNERINNLLIPELVKLLDDKNLPKMLAYNIAAFCDDDQMRIYQAIFRGVKISQIEKIVKAAGNAKNNELKDNELRKLDTLYADTDSPTARKQSAEIIQKRYVKKIDSLSKELNGVASEIGKIKIVESSLGENDRRIKIALIELHKRVESILSEL